MMGAVFGTQTMRNGTARGAKRRRVRAMHLSYEGNPISVINKSVLVLLNYTFYRGYGVVCSY